MSTIAIDVCLRKGIKIVGWFSWNKQNINFVIFHDTISDTRNGFFCLPEFLSTMVH